MSSCEHTVASLLKRTQYAEDSERVLDAQIAAMKEKQDGDNAEVQTMQTIQMQTMVNFGGMTGLPIIPPIPAPTTIAKERLLHVTDRSPLFDALGRNVRMYDKYSLDHSVVFDAMVSLFGHHQLGVGAQPADAFAFISAFTLPFSILDASDELPSKMSSETITSARNACHFFNYDESYICSCAQQIAAKPVLLEYARFIVCLMLCGKDYTSSLLVHVAISLFKSQFFPVQLPQPITPIIPLHEYIPFCVAASNSDLTEAPTLILSDDGRLFHDGKRVTLLAYLQAGLLISTFVSSGVDADDSKLPPVEETISFKAPVIVAPPATRPSPDAVCAGCSLATTPLNRQLSVYTSALVTADLTTATDPSIATDGITTFRANGLAWDDKRKRIVRTGLRTFHADVFDLHTAAGFKNIPGLSVLFGTDLDQQHQFAQAVSNGISVGTVLLRVDDYVVDHIGRVTSITIAGQKKYATQMHGKLTWGDEATHAFTFDDVVY